MNSSESISCPVFLINLDRSEARLEVSTKQLEAAGVSFHRIAAVDGQGVPISHFKTYDSKQTRRYYGRDMNSGEIGCYLSHVSALRAFLETDEDYCLVLEDDFLVKPETWELMRLLEEAIHKGDFGDWDLINLTKEPGKIWKEFRKLQGPNYSTTVSDAFYFPTRATATLWSRRGVKRFLAKSENPLCPIDHLFRKRVSEDLRGLGTAPTPFWVTGAESEIELASPDWEKPRGLSWYRVKEITRQIRVILKARRKNVLAQQTH